MVRKEFLLIVFVALLFNLAASAQVNNDRLTGQKFTGEITVNQDAHAVWEVLTDMQKISKVMGYDYKGKVKFAKPGDKAPLTIWSDTGTYLLSYAEPGKEIRFMWEPDNGNYLCQTRWRFTASGKTTKVMFEERYTESGTQSEEDIAAQVKGYNEALSRLKTICER
jgi:uncharacterized protein YndB with AHSA1/START domain